MNKSKGRIFIVLGLLLMAAALLLAAYNLYDARRAGQAARQAAAGLEAVMPAARAEEQGTPDYILTPEIEMPVKTVDGIDYIGVVRIPALELELPVAGEWNDANLKTAPCRYSGSAYLDNLILCGHNYVSHFGGLTRLRAGDVVTFTDVDGNVFTYEIVERETLPGTSVTAMESGDWDLTLFTCTLDGKSRITYRFERAEA